MIDVKKLVVDPKIRKTGGLLRRLNTTGRADFFMRRKMMQAGGDEMYDDGQTNMLDSEMLDADGGGYQMSQQHGGGSQFMGDTKYGGTKFG